MLQATTDAVTAAAPAHAAQPMDAAQPGPARELALMFTDVVGSVELKTRLGTAAYARLLARHDELFHRAVATCAGARILQDRGDGFFAEFPTAADAVRAALVFQYELSRIAQRSPDPTAVIRSRVGIHLGPAPEPEIDPTGKSKI